MIITGTRVRGGKYYGGTASAVTTDEYFNLVALLLPGNGTNGAQNNTFVDSSTNAFTITRNGNTTQGTFSPFSQTGWSNYFDGTGDSLTTPASSQLAFGTGNFTVEFWVNFASTTNRQDLVWWGVSGADRGGLIYNELAGNLTYYISPTVARAINYAWTPTVGVWYHIALVRISNSTKLYIDGTQVGSTYTDNKDYASSSYIVTVAQDNSSASSYFYGYMSNLRLVKGTGVYTTTFTPPTTPLTAISGTSLLTCQSNRFVDNSTNAFAITVAGNTSIQAFAPFDPATAYAAGTVGGSAYFDGTGDSIVTSTYSNQLSFGTGDFTIEFWVYPSASSRQDWIDFRAESGTKRIQIYYSGSAIRYDDGEPAAQVLSYTLSAVNLLNQWKHIAVTRSSGQSRLFVNGALVAGPTTDSFNSSAPFNVTQGRDTAGSTYVTGYISNLRIVKGAAVYTSAFTPPTAPLTAIANTQLLVNYTNGGITDAAAKNVLETIADAQISTAQSKFGGSSIAFDGTGDYLMIPNSQNFVFGRGDFTIEFWLRLNANNARQQIAYHGNVAGTNVPFLIELNTSFKLRFLIQTSGGQILVDSSATPSTNTWIHVACVRNGTSAYLFVDGVSQGTITPGTNALVTENTPVYIGTGLSSPLNGYIDDFRVTKGYARYTANFTPPTTAFPTQ